MSAAWTVPGGPDGILALISFPRATKDPGSILVVKALLRRRWL